MKRKILIQLDPDNHPSVFDRVVAIDAGVDELFSYGNVQAQDVQSLVHGAIFTRGPADLHATAIFVGGSNVQAGEKILSQVQKIFFGPMSVSVMLDANGANTTAAAAVLAAGKHLDLSQTNALVLGGTGPVGQRAARLLANEGATVYLASRSLDRAKQAASAINKPTVTGVTVDQQGHENAGGQILSKVQLVIAAGAAGVTLFNQEAIQKTPLLKVLIDLNAVPPAGIDGVQVMDKKAKREGLICYGAIGVGGTKMKIHKAAIARLFESNNQVLDAEAIYAIGKSL